MIGAGRLVVSVGIDAVEVDRIRRAVASDGFVARVFTPSEITYCRQKRDPAERFAARFAAKEAALKALGVGLGAVPFGDLEVEVAQSGAPRLIVGGRGRELAAELGIGGWLISLTHTDQTATAFVVGVQ